MKLFCLAPPPVGGGAPLPHRENGIQTLHPFDRMPTSWSLQVLPERVLELFQPVQQELEPELEFPL